MRHLYLVSFCLILLVSPLKAMNFSGDWRYIDSSGETGAFSQIYSLTLSSQATNALNLGSTIRYSRVNRSSQYQELLSPVFFLSLVNDYFNFNLSATDSERHNSEGADYSSRSWNAIISSFYKEIVDTKLYYGSSKERDNADPHQIDTKNNYWGLNLSKDWKGLDVYYDYRGSHSEDYANVSTTNDFSHLLRASYAGSWRRLSYSLSQQFNYSKNRWEGQIENGKAKYPIKVSIEWLPTNWQNQLPAGSNSDDFNSYIYLVQNADPNQDSNYGILIDLGTEEIGYLEFFYDSKEWKAIPNDVKWDIYYSRDKIIWTQLASNVSLPYDFSTPSYLNFNQARYLLLIPRTTFAQSLQMNNSPLFRAYKYITSSQYKRLLHAYRTDVLLSYNFTDNLSLSYSFSADRSEPTPGPDSKDIMHAFSSSWFVNKYFQPNMAFSYTKNKAENEPDYVMRNFSFSVFSDILPTLNVSTSFTRTLLEEGGRKKGRNNIFNVSTSAQVYPDLDLRWDITYSNNYNYETDISSRNFYSRINAIARIKPSITLNSIYQFDWNDTSNTSSLTSHYIMFDLSWTFSDSCSFHGMEGIKFSEDETTVNSTYSIWFSLTPKTQINFQYSGLRDNNKTDQISSFFSWRISRYFSFKSNYSWTKTDNVKSWSWMLNLTARF